MSDHNVPRQGEEVMERAGARWTESSDPGPAFLRELGTRVRAEAPTATVEPITVPSSRRWWLAAAASIALVAGIASLLQTRDAAPIGRVQFAVGATIPGAELQPNQSITTSSDGRSIAQLDGERIRLHLAESTSLEVRDKATVRVEQGEIWVAIVPNSGRFAVETPQATVVATGTTFGVTVGPKGTEVVLESGRVTLETPERTNTMEPGARASVPSDSSQPEVIRGSAGVRPPWVDALVAECAAAEAARRYPSGAPAPAAGGNRP